RAGPQLDGDGGVRRRRRFPLQARAREARREVVERQRRQGLTTELLVAGSVALDTLDGPFGTVTDELGGSALYFALAASLIAPVRMIAPIGRESVDAVRDAIAGRPIDAGGVVVLEAPTYRWHAQQAMNRNIDLGNRDSI